MEGEEETPAATEEYELKCQEIDPETGEGEKRWPAAPTLKYKVSLCKDFLNGNCAMGHLCNFAHGEKELRGYTKHGLSKDMVYKTVLCKLFPTGNCNWGDACRFAHGETELRKPDPEAIAQQRQAHIKNNNVQIQEHKLYISQLETENDELKIENERLKAQVDILIRSNAARRGEERRPYDDRSYSSGSGSGSYNPRRHHYTTAGVGKRRYHDW